MTLRPNAVVREIMVDPNTGKASGVRVVNQITKRDYEEYGRVIVLCASTLESTRILLNSKSRQYPNGLGNSSGLKAAKDSMDKYVYLRSNPTREHEIERMGETTLIRDMTEVLTSLRRQTLRQTGGET